MKICEMMRQARLARKFSIEHMNSFLEVSPQYYKQLERGSSIPGERRFEAICIYLGLDYGSLLDQYKKEKEEYMNRMRLIQSQTRRWTKEKVDAIRKEAEKAATAPLVKPEVLHMENNPSSDFINQRANEVKAKFPESPNFANRALNCECCCPVCGAKRIK